MTMLDGRCEHGSLTMGCLYCQLVRPMIDACQVSAPRDPVDAIVRRIEDLERTRGVDAARIAVLEADLNLSRTTQFGLESRISALEAEILEMRTGR